MFADSVAIHSFGAMLILVWTPKKKVIVTVLTKKDFNNH